MHKNENQTKSIRWYMILCGSVISSEYSFDLTFQNQWASLQLLLDKVVTKVECKGLWFTLISEMANKNQLQIGFIYPCSLPGDLNPTHFQGLVWKWQDIIYLSPINFTVCGKWGTQSSEANILKWYVLLWKWVHICIMYILDQCLIILSQKFYKLAYLDKKFSDESRLDLFIFYVIMCLLTLRAQLTSYR